MCSKWAVNAETWPDIGRVLLCIWHISASMEILHAYTRLFEPYLAPGSLLEPKEVIIDECMQLQQHCEGR